MTYKEKLMEEHPECVREDGCCKGCPFTYDYEPEPDDSFCQKITCEECWGREITETNYGAAKRFEKYLKTAQPVLINVEELYNPVEKVYLTLSKAFFKHKSSCESELSTAIEKALVYLAGTLE